MLQHHALFANVNLTDCQKLALDKLNPMIEGDTRLGILRGYAGTGKTFLTAMLVKYLSTETNFNVVVMTPTGRAAKVLESEFDKFEVTIGPKTIHSVIYKAEPVDYSRDVMTLFASVSTSAGDTPSFFIVDESSMVGMQKSERKDFGLNFGSGSLLHDILEHANLRLNTHSRVLFVGDPGQLPPIQGRQHTPALEAHELLNVLTELETPNETIAECELNTILRQEEGSLKNFVSDVRLSYQALSPLPRNRREQVNPIAPQDVVPLFLERNNRLRDPERSIILAHRNADVYRYNRDVRHALGFSEQPLVCGDSLLVRRNRRVVDYGELNISRSLEDLTNGTFIQVVDQPTFHYECSIHLKKKTVTLRFWKASIRKLESEHTFTAYILQNLLDAEFWNDYKTAAQDVESAILVDFQQRMRTEHNLNPPKKSTDFHYSRYKMLADRDPYLNALRVNYGYAVTVHNAQGGEWDTVIVDPVNPARDGHSVQHLIDYTRWIYTASTRARKELFFVK